MCCNFKRFATLKKKNNCFFKIDKLLYPELLWIYKTGERWRLWLYLHVTIVERQIKSPSVQPQSVLISFIRESDGTGFSPVLERIRGGVFPKSWELYSCDCACQTSVWNSLLRLGEGVSFIKWWASWGPQNKRRPCGMFPLSAGARAAPAVSCSGYRSSSLWKYTQYRGSPFPKRVGGEVAMANVKHYDFLLKNWIRKVANVWALCVMWKVETETGGGGERDRANPNCLCWVHTYIQRKHTPVSSSWVKPQGDLCGFGPCFGEKKKNNPPITAMDFHENFKIFRLCYLQYLTENYWRCCLISATIPLNRLSVCFHF